MKWVSVVLGVASVASFAMSEYGRRYHTKAFDEHTTNLRKARGDNDKIQEELTRFREKEKVDLAIDVMFYGEMAGITFGFFAILLWFL